MKHKMLELFPWSYPSPRVVCDRCLALYDAGHLISWAEWRFALPRRQKSMARCVTYCDDCDCNAHITESEFIALGAQETEHGLVYGQAIFIPIDGIVYSETRRIGRPD